MTAPLRSLVRTLGPPLALGALVLLGWEILVRARHVEPLVLPSPHAVWHVLVSDRAELASAAAVTLGEVAAGLALGAGAGFVLAVLTAHSRLAQRGLYPALIATQAIPPVVLAPPLVIWLGYSLWPKAIVAALIVFFPVLVNTHQGLLGVDRDLVALVRAMGASAWQLFWRVRLPAAAPLVFAALRLGATYSVIGAVFGEWVGSERGLGIYILEAQSRLQTDRVYAAIVVLAALGIAAYGVVAALEALATPWRRRATRPRWAAWARGHARSEKRRGTAAREESPSRGLSS